MSRRPVLLRLIVPFGAIIVLLITLCGSMVYVASQHAAREQQIRELSRMTALVRETFEGKSKPSVDYPASTKRLADLARLLGTRVTLIDGAGNVVFDSAADPVTLENHNDRPEVAAARRSGAGSAIRFSRTINEDAVYVAQPLLADHPDGLIVRLSYPRHTWPTLAVPAPAIVLSAIVLSAIVLLALTLLLQRDWINPVRALSAVAHRLAAGEWQIRAASAGHEELRAFSDDLNFLATEAQKRLAELNAERAQLRALVDRLPDPIFLTDARQRIALINAPAARLLSCTPAEALGQPLVNLLNESSLIALFEQAQRGESVEPRDVRLLRHGQRLTFQAVALRPPSGSGVLLLLRDVTTMASAVQMKTDFVANAGHELRTPIHAIKLAFETLADVYQDDPAQATKCFEIAGGHLKRLEELLADLLDLSRVESADAEVQHANVSVDELFTSTRAALQTAARQKVVELDFQVSDDAPPTLRSDRRLLQLILRNLVENAIKYTPTGGRVAVTLSREENDAVLRVADNGIGIPPEHRERVFERFYQVDTSRAGTAGRGTGLGLAIVKHAIHALRGEVRLESEVGRGTIVECRFPIDAESVTDVG